MNQRALRPSGAIGVDGIVYCLNRGFSRIARILGFLCIDAFNNVLGHGRRYFWSLDFIASCLSLRVGRRHGSETWELLSQRASRTTFFLNSGVKFLRLRFVLGFSFQVDGYYTTILV